MVFLINGIPVLVNECKNATKEEGIALGIDQIRRAVLMRADLGDYEKLDNKLKRQTNISRTQQ